MKRLKIKIAELIDNLWFDRAVMFIIAVLGASLVIALCKFAELLVRVLE